MSQPWIVMKFGGTSVASVDHWAAIGRLVSARRQAGYRVLVVCSALAGVTDQLLALDRGSQSATGEGADLIEAVLARHRGLAKLLGIPAEPWLLAGADQLTRALAMRPGPRRTAAVLSCGEWWSSQLGARYLALNHKTDWVDAREALETLREPDPDGRRSWLSARCEVKPDAQLQQRWAALAPTLVVQGFVARGPGGATALLGRSGSDTSAALLASRLNASLVEVWTDVPGLFTADPRVQPDAYLIESLAWDEALEMAASGARVIHGQCIRVAAAGALNLHIRDLSRPDAPGTEILGNAVPGASTARAISTQPGMLVLLLQNLDTRQQVGFLSGVFETISQAGISVDQVATSETSTTLAINAAANHLDEKAIGALTVALAQHCQVTATRDCVCVSLIGRNARLAVDALGMTGSFFQDRPLHMMSHSANDLSISLLVEASHAPELANLLHRHWVLGETGCGE